MMKEEWQDIKGFEGYYQVSNTGQVRALPRYTYVHGLKRNDGERHNEYWKRKSRILKLIYPTGGSDAYVHLYKEGQPRRSVMVKRLVAETFIDGFDPKTKTHHIHLIDASKGYGVDNIVIGTSVRYSKHIDNV